MIHVNYVLLAKLAIFVLMVVIMTKAYLYFSVHLVHHLHPRYLDPSLARRRQQHLSGNASNLEKLDSADNRDLIWFAHLSDLHISKFYDPRRAEDFRSLCHFLSAQVRPSVVVVTGDITDAKDRNLYGSAQYREEWSTYREILQSCGVLNAAKWLDVRGNHDTFDVLSDVHTRNLFQRYAIQGKYHLRSYAEDIYRQGVSIRFVGIDFTPTPGLKRPFNFFGTLSDDELSSVRGMLSSGGGEDDSGATSTKYRVVFGHYPTSAISFMRPSVRDVLKEQLYLCGHYHTPLTYTRHKTGLLELELADWKDRRTYRIAAFDQGFFSFADRTYSSFNSNVAILVTNPKNPTYLLESEPISNMVRMPWVRTLVFSDVPVSEVGLQLPGEEVVRMDPVPLPDSPTSPLYTAPWTPEFYAKGVHKLTIYAKLKDGQVVEHTDSFSLDGTQPPFNFRSRLLLMMDWQPFSEYVFAVFACVIILSLSMLRISHRHSVQLSLAKDYGEDEYSVATLFFRKFWILASLDAFLYPLIAFVMYACFMPWACGYVLNDRLGIILAWGTFLIDDFSYIPPDMIHIYGCGALVLQVLFMYILACTVEETYLESKPDEEAKNLLAKKRLSSRELLSVCVQLLHDHIGFVCVVVFQFHNTWALYGSYGFISIVSPCGTGRIFLTMYLYSKAISLEGSDLAEAKRVWPLRRGAAKNKQIA